MSVVGQRELRGEIWLTLDCGHEIRREMFVGGRGTCHRCHQNKTDDAKQKLGKRPGKARSRRKKSKAEYMPYTASNTKSPVSSETQNQEDAKKPFFWRGRLRKP